VPAHFGDTAKLGLFEGVAFEPIRMRSVAPVPPDDKHFGDAYAFGRSDGSVTAKARVKGTTPRPSCVSAPAPASARVATSLSSK
jgi:hypothetical protein